MVAVAALAMAASVQSRLFVAPRVGLIEPLLDDLAITEDKGTGNGTTRWHLKFTHR